MKTLDLNQMETIHGGIECSSWWGLASGAVAAGLLLGPVTLGLSCGIGGLIGLGFATAAAVNCDPSDY